MKVELTLKNGERLEFETEDLEWSRDVHGLTKLTWDETKGLPYLLWVELDEVVAIRRLR